MIWVLHGERDPGIVVAYDGDSSPTETRMPDDVEFGSESLNPNKVLVGVLVLMLGLELFQSYMDGRLTSVYWPGTSISSTLLYWNSVK